MIGMITGVVNGMAMEVKGEVATGEVKETIIGKVIGADRVKDINKGQGHLTIETDQNKDQGHLIIETDQNKAQGHLAIETDQNKGQGRLTTETYQNKSQGHQTIEDLNKDHLQKIAIVGDPDLVQDHRLKRETYLDQVLGIDIQIHLIVIHVLPNQRRKRNIPGQNQEDQGPCQNHMTDQDLVQWNMLRLLYSLFLNQLHDTFTS